MVPLEPGREGVGERRPRERERKGQGGGNGDWNDVECGEQE